MLSFIPKRLMAIESVLAILLEYLPLINDEHNYQRNTSYNTPEH